MMKTNIFFVTFSILISLYGHDVECPFVKFMPNCHTVASGDVIGLKQGDPKSIQSGMVTEINQMPLEGGTSNAVDVNTIKSDPNLKKYIIITEETQMPLEGDIVEYLSVGDNDYLEKVKQLIKDKLLEESILAYAKEIHLKVSNDELLRNITAMEKQDLMRY